MLSSLKNSKWIALAALLFASAPAGTMPAAAAERYPEVARLSFVSGGVTFSRGDDPDEWDDALENIPLTVGDRIYAPRDGRAEIQFSSGNFVRIAPRSYFSTLNLSEDTKQFYLGEGSASFRIRHLAPDEVFEVGTPNISVTFEEPGQYRLAVDDNGDSRIIVRRGRAVLAAGGRQLTVANSEVRVYGMDAPRYEIVGLAASDDFERWTAERDHRYERDFADANRFASEHIIGAEDLAGHGRWERIPDYGYAWTPTVVAAGWTPFSNGRWYWQDPWGWNWISHERWGWATSHYGRWTPYRSRWYWVPVPPRTRVRYAPACVEFVRVRDHVGWFPLHPRDRHIPSWERRDRRLDRNVTYINRNYVTIVNHNHFISARPVHRHIVRDTVILRDARAAHFADTLPIPNRSSLRVISEEGRRRGFKPSDHVLNRVAVVRTAPPPPPRVFQEKLPEIEKNQGRALEPARMLASADRARWVRVRPAAETDRGELAPRNASAGGGAPLQAVTEARGKKLATRESRIETSRDTAQNSQAQQPSQARPDPSAQPLQEKSAHPQPDERKALPQKQQERVRPPEAEQRTVEQKQQDAERNIQPQKQRQEPQAAPRTPEQQRLEELERQSRLEEERKAQAQRRQEQERQNAIEKQRQRQGQEEKKIETDRRQDERKAQAHQQQEQARREQQIRQQQQALERQARELQRQQQAIERQQLQQQREREKVVQSQPREPQPQLQERQLRQLQPHAPREAQPQQERRVQPRRPQPPEQPTPQPVPPTLRQPGQ